MFSWTLGPIIPKEFDIEEIMKRIIHRESITTVHIRNIDAWLSRCKMRVCLREMSRFALRKLYVDSTHEAALSFLVELLAGFKYAIDDPSVGRLRELRKCFNCCTSKVPLEFLRQQCDRAIEHEEWRSRNLWFKLRVYCMDAYVLSQIFAAREGLILYYAGMAHTRHVEKYLRQENLLENVEHYDALF